MEEEDEKEEDGFFFEFTAHHNMRPTCAPEGGRGIIHADLPENHELETQVTNTEFELEEAHEMDEYQYQENMGTQSNESHSEGQPDEVMEEEEMPTSPHPTNSETVDEDEPRDQRPRRERRAPKMFTYDQLGTPACYSTVQADQIFNQYQPRLYGEAQPMTM